MRTAAEANMPPTRIADVFRSNILEHAYCLTGLKGLRPGRSEGRRPTAGLGLKGATSADVRFLL